MKMMKAIGRGFILNEPLILLRSGGKTGTVNSTTEMIGIVLGIMAHPVVSET